MDNAEASKSVTPGEGAGTSKSSRARRRKKNKRLKQEGHEDNGQERETQGPSTAVNADIHSTLQNERGHTNEAQNIHGERRGPVNEVPQSAQPSPESEEKRHQKQQQKPQNQSQDANSTHDDRNPEQQYYHGKHHQRHRPHNIQGADPPKNELESESDKRELSSKDIPRKLSIENGVNEVAASYVSTVNSDKKPGNKNKTVGPEKATSAAKPDQIKPPETLSDDKPAEDTENRGDNEPVQKSKSQLRAERRAKQEAQRAAKAERLQASGKAPPTKPQPKCAEGAGENAESKKDRKTAKLNSQKTKDETGGRDKKPELDKKSSSAKEPNVITSRIQRKSEGGDEFDGRLVSSSYHSDEMIRVPTELRHDDPQQVKKKIKRLEKQNLFQRAETHKKVSLFSHLPQYQIEQGVLPETWKAGSSPVHAAFYRIGVQIAYGSIRGANHRCLALAEALSTFIDSYKRTEDKEFARHFESVFSPNITFLSQCRPLTAGMRSFVKTFKAQVVSVGREEKLTDDEKKSQLKQMVYDFIREKIILAGETIAKNASEKINDKSCLLTYAYSTTVCSVFAYAKNQGTNFSVIVADSEPLFEGRRMIRFLEKQGIECEYVSLTGVPSIMHRVTGVFIGAQALFNNGSVLSRAGTGFVACIAEQYSCSTHVCCESYKFWERVQLDSFVYNDLSDPGILIKDSKMREEWENPKSPLHYLNPQYDVTPPELIDVVITELCLMPGSSVPVVLRRNAL